MRAVDLMIVIAKTMQQSIGEGNIIFHLKKHRGDRSFHLELCWRNNANHTTIKQYDLERYDYRVVTITSRGLGQERERKLQGRSKKFRTYLRELF